MLLRIKLTHVEQSRGVPSMTPRPGMVTPLDPWIEVTRPWAEASAKRVATATMVLALKYMIANLREALYERTKESDLRRERTEKRLKGARTIVASTIDNRGLNRSRLR